MSDKHVDDESNAELNNAISESISSLNYSKQNETMNLAKDDDLNRRDDINIEKAIGEVFSQFDFKRKNSSAGDASIDEKGNEEHGLGHIVYDSVYSDKRDTSDNVLNMRAEEDENRMEKASRQNMTVTSNDADSDSDRNAQMQSQGVPEYKGIGPLSPPSLKTSFMRDQNLETSQSSDNFSSQADRGYLPQFSKEDDKAHQQTSDSENLTKMDADYRIDDEALNDAIKISLGEANEQAVYESSSGVPNSQLDNFLQQREWNHSHRETRQESLTDDVIAKAINGVMDNLVSEDINDGRHFFSNEEKKKEKGEESENNVSQLSNEGTLPGDGKHNDPHPQSVPSSVDTKDNEDLKGIEMDSFMANAINEAIQSAFDDQKASRKVDDRLSQENTRTDYEQQLNIMNSLQNSSTPMSTRRDSRTWGIHSGSISQEVMHDLASEISHHVEGQDDGSTNKNIKENLRMPEIDESTFEHFHNEAYKEYNNNNSLYPTDGNEPNNKDKLLQTTLSNIIRNVIEHSHTSEKESSDIGKQEAQDADLYQMATILQNSFSMALGETQELKTEEKQRSSQKEEMEKSSAEISEDAQAIQISNAVSKILELSASTSSFLDSLNNAASGSSAKNLPDKHSGLEKFADVDKESSKSKLMDRVFSIAKNLLSSYTDKTTKNHVDKEDPRRKSLNIAETLALHRSAIYQHAKKDNYTNEVIDNVIKKYKDSDNTGLPSFTSNFSTTLSNFVSRIGHETENDGDRNILKIIRELGSSGSLSLPLRKEPTLNIEELSVSDIIANYRTKSVDHSLIIPLILGKDYLEKNFPLTSVPKALSIIENTLSLSSEGVNLELHLREGIILQYVEATKPSFVMSFMNSIMTAISIFNNSKSKKGQYLLGEKYLSDSPEYKERIRLENRERKKRWREENAERNKDNDLRFRVLKRAGMIFGEDPTPEKKAWIEEEFERRREKRIAKQRKEEQERQLNALLDKTFKSKPFNEKDTSSICSDLSFVNPISDIFKLLSIVSYTEEPEAALVSTVTSTAVAAALYTHRNNLLNCKSVEIALTNTLSSLMENSQGHELRYLNLAKGLPFFKELKMFLPKGEQDFNSTLTALNSIGNKKESHGSPNIPVLNFNVAFNSHPSIGQYEDTVVSYKDAAAAFGEGRSRKRSLSESSLDMKRTGDTSPKKHSNVVSIDSGDNGSVMNNDLGDRHFFNAAYDYKDVTNKNNLGGIPLGRPKTSSSEEKKNLKSEFLYNNVSGKEYPTLSLPLATPFITNKKSFLNKDNKIIDTVNSLKGRLKKPGSFQRPAFSKTRY